MKKHFIIAVAALAVTAALTLLLEAERSASGVNCSYAKRIPLLLGSWRGEEQEVSEAVVETLRTSDLLMRFYTDDEGRGITFAAVFATDNRRAAHPPEICYDGQGWSVEGKTSRTVAVRLPASGYQPPGENGQSAFEQLQTVKLLENTIDFAFTELVIRDRSTDRRQLVYYWYKTGGRSTNSLLVHELDMLVNNIFHRGSSNSLLRVSTEVVSASEEDIQAARDLVQGFCKVVFPYTIAAMP